MFIHYLINITNSNMETPLSMEEYGHYCDIEIHTPPRIFISVNNYEYRVVQLTESPQPKQKPQPSKYSNHTHNKPKPLWKQLLYKYTNCNNKTETKYVGESELDYSSYYLNAVFAFGITVLVICL